MTDYSVFSTGVAHAGSARWRMLKRGETYVEHDQKRFFYSIPSGMRRGFRTWIANTFENSDGVPQVIGTYPDGYHLFWN